jgi:MFS family permease
MSNRGFVGPERRNLSLLLAARGIRAFGDGFVSILVPVYLTGLGIGAFEVGVLTTAMLLGPAMMTLAIGLIAHRLRAVTLLTGATVLMVVSGIGYAFETEFWPLLVIAVIGTLNPTASDVSVFAPLEQTLLSNAVLPRRRTSIFASYSLVGSLLGAVPRQHCISPRQHEERGFVRGTFAAGARHVRFLPFVPLGPGTPLLREPGTTNRGSAGN